MRKLVGAVMLGFLLIGNPSAAECRGLSAVPPSVSEFASSLAISSFAAEHNVLAAGAPTQCGKGKAWYGKPCDDGNACTYNDQCGVSGCTGLPYTCDDGSVCTSDSCDGSGGCVRENRSGPCDDKNSCTHSDVCVAGVCTGTAYNCVDSNQCTTDSCDGNGGCVFEFRTGGCDDSDSCTFGDSCSSGVCAGTAYSCDDGNACTLDVCDGTGSCTDLSEAEYCLDGYDNDFDCLVDGEDPDCSSCEFTCGGDFCPPGYVCGWNGCCVPHCNDGQWNGTEGDVDCGGHCPTKCQNGQHCWTSGDCESNYCYYDVCEPHP